MTGLILYFFIIWWQDRHFFFIYTHAIMWQEWNKWRLDSTCFSRPWALKLELQSLQQKPFISFLSSELGEGKICSPLTSLSSKCLSPFKHNWVLRRVRSSPSLNTEITNPTNKLRTASEIQDQVYTQLRRRRSRRKRENFLTVSDSLHIIHLWIWDFIAGGSVVQKIRFQRAPELLWEGKGYQKLCLPTV